MSTVDSLIERLVAGQRELHEDIRRIKERRSKGDTLISSTHTQTQRKRPKTTGQYNTPNKLFCNWRYLSALIFGCYDSIKMHDAY